MRFTFNKKCVLCVFAVFSLSYVASVSQADTVAYWRFEDSPGFLEDSGPNNIDLSIYDGDSNSANDPTQYSLPATGAGSYFPNPITQTGESNLKGVNIIHNHDGLVGSDNSALAFTSGFTIETFFNRDTRTDHRTIFMQGYTSGSTQRAENLELRKEGTIRLSLSADGSALSTIYSSDLTYSADTDYYLATVVNLTDSKVTFFLKDLTNGGELEQETIAVGVSSLFNSTADFYIGAFMGSSTSTLNDVFDEIRISNVALSEGDFLINQVPEPSAIVLLATGLFGLLAYAWKKRR